MDDILESLLFSIFKTFLILVKYGRSIYTFYERKTMTMHANVCLQALNYFLEYSYTRLTMFLASNKFFFFFLSFS